MKKYIPLIIVLACIVFVYIGIKKMIPLLSSGSLSSTTPMTVFSSVKNMPYVILNKTFTLKGGKAEVALTPGSSSVNILLMFGEPVYGDLDGDGDTDAAILLANSPGGSGTFYYAVLAIKNGKSYTSTNALLLGDRITPQTVEIKEGRALYNYAVRKDTDPVTTSPSIGKSLWIHYDAKTNTIGELAKDFEGEADITKMNLTMKTWEWFSTTYHTNNTKILPKTTKKFTITFHKDKTFSVTTDCNNIDGNYSVASNTIAFTKMTSTLMFCEGSQETTFKDMLQETNGYHFTSKGELILDLKLNDGSVVFK